jgi:hypothetical protein
MILLNKRGMEKKNVFKQTLIKTINKLKCFQTKRLRLMSLIHLIKWVWLMLTYVVLYLWFDTI